MSSHKRPWRPREKRHWKKSDRKKHRVHTLLVKQVQEQPEPEPVLPDPIGP